MTRCSSCGGETPSGNFCVRCGAPQGTDFSGSSRGRGHYAAAPHEHVALPFLVSSLFPHLPRASHRWFQIALALAGVVVIALSIARLFPLALIAAAVAMPLLVTLYLFEVDVYEDEPLWAMTLTIAWGAFVGVGFGLLALALTPSVASVLVGGGSRFVVYQGLVLPFCGLFALLGGPLILLRYHRFNSVLDGVTFGAAAAAAFGGAEAITYGIHLMAGGIRPGGAVLPWIWRLTSLGIAMPVLVMGAGAAACAALWLRYRAPARDENALGLVGHAAIALPLAALLVTGGAVGETFLPAGAWLAWLIAFDVVVIVLLRRAIHVGLLEEALKDPIGPEFTCPNCGHQTARHTFCSNCGISLQALPKGRHSASASPGPAPSPAAEPGT